MIKLFKLLFTCGLLATVSFSSADSELSIEDRLMITDALAQYSYRWDGKDAEGFSQLFTEDAQMERWVLGERVDASVVQGREAIKEYASVSHNGRLADRQTRHHFSALVFEEVGEEFVVTKNMALITHQTAGGPPFISSSGIYRITWQKTGESWLMAKRVLFSDRVE